MVFLGKSDFTQNEARYPESQSLLPHQFLSVYRQRFIALTAAQVSGSQLVGQDPKVGHGTVLSGSSQKNVNV